jgi:GNAT superfamily N-acetyltransferase
VNLKYSWRGHLDDDELVELTRAHGGRPEPGWWDKIRPHSLGWVTVRDGPGSLVAFANVAWDGGGHAFLLDPKVRPDHQHQGIGTEVVRRAAAAARRAGCEWLHVDFDQELAAFYFDACGFDPTPAGLIHLRQ